MMDITRRLIDFIKACRTDWGKIEIQNDRARKTAADQLGIHADEEIIEFVISLYDQHRFGSGSTDLLEKGPKLNFDYYKLTDEFNRPLYVAFFNHRGKWILKSLHLDEQARLGQSLGDFLRKGST